MRLESGQQIITFLEPYAQIMDKELFRQHCVAEGLEQSMHLPWNTANSMTKELLLKGEPEPPGVSIYAVTKIRLLGE